MSGIQKNKFPFEQADDAFVISPSDTVNFVADSTNNPNAYTLADIYVGGTGDVAVMFPGATTSKVFKAVPAGTRLRVTAVRVNATLTTATNLLGLVSGTGMGV